MTAHRKASLEIRPVIEWRAVQQVLVDDKCQAIPKQLARIRLSEHETSST